MTPGTQNRNEKQIVQYNEFIVPAIYLQNAWSICTIYITMLYYINFIAHENFKIKN